MELGRGADKVGQRARPKLLANLHQSDPFPISPGVEGVAGNATLRVKNVAATLDLLRSCGKRGLGLPSVPAQVSRDIDPALHSIFLEDGRHVRGGP